METITIKVERRFFYKCKIFCGVPSEKYPLEKCNYLEINGKNWGFCVLFRKSLRNNVYHNVYSGMILRCKECLATTKDNIN
jgi:hypothetical protein